MTEIILLITGVLVGGMNAIAGGGNLIGFPIMLAVGIPPLVANATTSIVTLPGSIASAFGYRKYLRQIPRSFMWLLIPCAIGAFIGAYILRQTSASDFEQYIPGLIFFAVFLFAVQPFLHFHLHRTLKGKQKGDYTLFWIALGLLPTAIYGGYFGAGFGFIVLAFLGFTSLHDVHKMNALKNLAGATVCIVSIATLWTTGLIDWRTGLIMGAGSIIGGYYGARLALKISTHAFRMTVIVFGFSAALYLALRTY